MITQTFTEFGSDLKIGKIGERIFIEDFLEFLDFSYINVTDMQGFRIMDGDILTKFGLYEIKANYKDDCKLVIEEYSNINTNYSSLSKGWFYTSKADVFVFVSKKTRSMIILPATKLLRSHYEKIKTYYSLIYNKPTRHNGYIWQSAFRRIPLIALDGYFAIYQKNRKLL